MPTPGTTADRRNTGSKINLELATPFTPSRRRVMQTRARFVVTASEVIWVLLGQVPGWWCLRCYADNGHADEYG